MFFLLYILNVHSLFSILPTLYAASFASIACFCGLEIRIDDNRSPVSFGKRWNKVEQLRHYLELEYQISSTVLALVKLSSLQDSFFAVPEWLY